MVVKIHVLLKCEHCQGQAYLFVGEAEDFYGQKYDRYKPCPNCEGSGMAAKWVALPEFRQLLEQSESQHECVSKEVG